MQTGRARGSIVKFDGSCADELGQYFLESGDSSEVSDYHHGLEVCWVPAGCDALVGWKGHGQIGTRINVLRTWTGGRVGSLVILGILPS
jgi:hypothetical protein